MSNVLFFWLSALSFGLAGFKVSSPVVDFFPLGFCLLTVGVALGQAMKEGTPAPKPENTSHLRTLSNGAVYDMQRKRIVNSKGVTNKITSQNAADYAAMRVEAKRARLMFAANAVAAQGGSVDGRELTGDLAFVEAIGEAMTMKALSVNDPKAVDAARFIFNETGISEKAAQAEQQADDPLRMIGAMALEYIKQKLTIPIQLHDTNSADNAGNVE